MFERTLDLARQLNSTLVIFDLEHTGATWTERGITDFGAMLVSPNGELTSLSFPVKPPEFCTYNSVAMGLTKITPESRENSPPWSYLFGQFIEPLLDAIWIGFGCADDFRLLNLEAERLGKSMKELKHLDIQKLLPFKANLEATVARLCPKLNLDADIRAHTAYGDATLTLQVLQAVLRDGRPLGEQILKKQLTLVTTPQQPRVAAQLPAFMARKHGARIGHAWADGELEWLTKAHAQGKAEMEVAFLSGRSVAELLDKLQRSSWT